jgi:hypothetical protein
MSRTHDMKCHHLPARTATPETNHQTCAICPPGVHHLATRFMPQPTASHADQICATCPPGWHRLATRHMTQQTSGCKQLRHTKNTHHMICATCQPDVHLMATRCTPPNASDLQHEKERSRSGPHAHQSNITWPLDTWRTP